MFKSLVYKSGNYSSIFLNSIPEYSLDTSLVFAV